MKLKINNLVIIIILVFSVFFINSQRVQAETISCGRDYARCPDNCTCIIPDTFRNGTCMLTGDTTSYCIANEEDEEDIEETEEEVIEEEKEKKEEKSITFKPQITIPGSSFTEGASTTVTTSTAFIGEYIKAIYNYLLAIVGLLAAIVLMVSGIIWLTAAGNSERISQAKSWMMGSLTGLILALSSFLLLKTINPNLVDFKIQEIETVKPIEWGCCQFTSEAKMIGITECSDNKGTFYKNYSANSTQSVCQEISKEQIAENNTQCKDKKFGERCIDDDGSGEDKCWCYYEQVYRGRVGEINDYCGITEGSKCVEDRTCNVPSTGGRNCRGTSDCCQKEGTINSGSYSDYKECENVANGEKCIDTKNCWCYNNKPYTGKGKQGEYCGQEDDYISSCEYNILDDGTYGIGCPGGQIRDFGGRSCGTDLYCCY
ncbi:MAG TPA: pilin [bacterium]|nr:pilin [bacterium]